MIFIHSGIMLVGMLLLALGIAVAIFFREKTWWLRRHRTSVSWGVAALLPGFVAAIYMVSRQTGVHLAVPHAWLGMVTIAFALSTYLMGMIMIKKVNAAIGPFHRWSGRATIVMILLNIISGLYLTGVL